MCLRIDKSHKFLWLYKAKKAKRPITVYKLLTITNKTPVRYCEYKFGFNYPNEPSKRFIKTETITSGFLHAYKSYELAEREENYYRIILGMTVRIVEMTIPKGSLYFVGNDGTICASCLKW